MVQTGSKKGHQIITAAAAFHFIERMRSKHDTQITTFFYLTTFEVFTALRQFFPSSLQMTESYTLFLQCLPLTSLYMKSQNILKRRISLKKTTEQEHVSTQFEFQLYLPCLPETIHCLNPYPHKDIQWSNNILHINNYKQGVDTCSFSFHLSIVI